MDVVRSVNGVPIRLTDERWEHVLLSHKELRLHREAVLETVRAPVCVLRGHEEELHAVAGFQRGWLIVVYKEISATDGFVITAYMKRADPRSGNREIVWAS